MKDYILFIPPAEIAEIRPRLWNSKQAKLYYNWLMLVKDDRVEYLLTAIDENLTSNDEEDLARIGGKITQLLLQPPFSEKKNDELVITNKGLAIAADLSLLIAQLILKNYPQRLKWAIVKRPKGDLAYNLPAIYGFPQIEYIEPMRGAITNAKAILTNERQASIWVEMYKYALNLIEQM